MNFKLRFIFIAVSNFESKYLFNSQIASAEAS